MNTNILKILMTVIIFNGCFFSSEEKNYPAPELINLTVKLYDYKITNNTLDSHIVTVPQPEDNPATIQGVALGRALFHDPILSGDGTMSCATCHAQKFAFSDNGNQFSRGITGIVGATNTPAIVNAAWDATNFWDGRATSLEEQVLGPVANPIEMNSRWSEVVKRLEAVAEYKEKFGLAFGSDEIDSTRVTKAIAQYERTLLSFNSKFDRIRQGLENYSFEEAQGVLIFVTERGDCFHCHNQPFFTDNLFHNNGLDTDSVIRGTGRGAVTGLAKDDGLWNTPTLRNVEFSAPYMHDGRFQTLEEVIDFYASGGRESATVDPLIAKNFPIRVDANSRFYNPLTQLEKSYLLAFLKTLSDPSFLTKSEFGPP